jgi:hypothetical protein
MVVSYRFLFEVNVGSKKSLIQGLNRTEVVAKRSFWQIHVSLHHFSKRVHLWWKEEKWNVWWIKGWKQVVLCCYFLTSCLDIESGLLTMIQVTVSKQPGIVIDPSYVTKLLRSVIKEWIEREGTWTCCPVWESSAEKWCQSFCKSFSSSFHYNEKTITFKSDPRWVSG